MVDAPWVIPPTSPTVTSEPRMLSSNIVFNLLEGMLNSFWLPSLPYIALRKERHCSQMWDLALVLETAHDTLHVSNMLQAYATQVHSGWAHIPLLVRTIVT